MIIRGGDRSAPHEGKGQTCNQKHPKQEFHDNTQFLDIEIYIDTAWGDPHKPFMLKNAVFI